MADTKRGREEQAANEERRQREREVSAARNRGDEAEPTDENAGDSTTAAPDADGNRPTPRECHRRGCNEVASFVVLERYQEETGHGTVEARAFLCPEHTAEESPANLDDANEEYVFRVEPLESR